MMDASEVAVENPMSEHPEKSEFSRNLTIVVAPASPHTIRYVSMDWSHRWAPPGWRTSSLVVAEPL
jgi:hypothetical protein